MISLERPTLGYIASSTHTLPSFSEWGCVTLPPEEDSNSHSSAEDRLSNRNTMQIIHETQAKGGRMEN